MSLDEKDFKKISEITRDIIREEVGSIKEEVGSLREEVGSVKEEVGSVKEELGSVREEVGSVREEVSKEIESLAVLTVQEFDKVHDEFKNVYKELANLKTNQLEHDFKMTEMVRKTDIVKGSRYRV